MTFFDESIDHHSSIVMCNTQIGTEKEPALELAMVLIIHCCKNQMGGGKVWE